MAEKTWTDEEAAAAVDDVMAAIQQERAQLTVRLARAEEVARVMLVALERALPFVTLDEVKTASRDAITQAKEVL